MLYEVKMGIKLTTSRVVVDPLSAPLFDYAMGQLLLSYDATGHFHAQLPAAFSGNRNFTVTHLAAGSWTVTATGASPFSVPVGTDGVLSFEAQVGGGMVVDAVLSSKL
jgi:hypothetical protein